jgi:hypothetical protein
MILIDQLPKSRKITAYLDADIKQVVQEFFLKNYLAEENIETKQQLLRDTKESIVKYVSPIIDLSEFPFMYPVNGITDGLNTLAVECRNKTIKTFDGEYDWLQLNLPKNVNYNTGDVLYVSNPSSIDGNYISNWNEIINTHQDIALDCAYIGSCRIEKIEINENINTVYVGLSKMFGLSELRIGYVFRRTPSIPLGGLLRNFYFNSNNLKLTIELFKNFDLDYLHKKHKQQQELFCEIHGLTPSDVIYLATTSDPVYNFYKKGSVNRICITNFLQ